MDLNGDGHLDILSGSYSRMEGDMAGLFQVLWGEGKGKWKKAVALKGDDGKDLVVTPVRTGSSDADDEDPDLDRICTRAFAVDLDADGKLELISGNFGGTFAIFAGLGDGKFAAKNDWLRHDGELLQVPMHSDPMLVDWDQDGDLDLISGSAEGSVHLFTNVGTKQRAQWAAGTLLHAAAPDPHNSYPSLAIRRSEQITAPGQDVRVWVADVDGDGKLDLLLGDTAHLTVPAAGLSDAQAVQRLQEWEKELNAAKETMLPQEPSEESIAKFQAVMDAREKFVTDCGTGFVWLLRRR